MNKVTFAHHLPPLQFSLNFVYHMLHIIKKSGTSLVLKHTNSLLLMNLSHHSCYHHTHSSLILSGQSPKPLICSVIEVANFYGIHQKSLRKESLHPIRPLP